MEPQLLTKIKPWTTITPTLMNLLLYMVMNSQVHRMISFFLKKTWIFKFWYYDLIIEEFLTWIYSKTHQPLCQAMCNKSTNLSCYSNSYSNELDVKSTKKGKASHDEEMMRWSFKHVYYNLGSLFGDVETPNEIVNSNSYHLIHNDLTKIISDNHIHIKKILTIPYNFYHSQFEGSRNHQEVEELQLPPMVMSSSHNPDDVLELGYNIFFSHNYFLRIVSIDVSSLLKDFKHF